MVGSSSHSSSKAHLQDPNPTPSSSSSMPTKPPKRKSLFTHYISKSLIIIVVLLVFSFFPSQVPEIFKKSAIINKLWELIYLLVIGIAVCYGLFSRKMDSVHSSDELDGAKEAYLSEISHISSIFEDGVQSSYEFDEKDSDFGNKFRKSDKKKLNQSFIGESLVVIDDKNYVLEQLSKRRIIKQNLGSKSLDSASGKSVLQDSSSGGDGIKKGRFRGLVPIKLEKKFKESGSDSNSDSDSNSQIPLNLRKKSVRSENIADESSHFTYPSVGILNLRSQSVRVSSPSQMKISSENKESKGEISFVESKPRVSSFDASSEMKIPSNSKEILKGTGSDSDSNSNSRIPLNLRSKSMRLADETLHLRNPSVGIVDLRSQSMRVSTASDTKLPSENKESKGDTSFTESKLWEFSYDSSEMKNLSNSKEFLQETVNDSPNSNLKPATVANTYKRGKSVRTKRPKEQVVEAKTEIFPSETVTEVEKGSKSENNATNVNPDDYFSDPEPHSGEVDRKADEFIAKFREQIRLQQAASARRLNFI